jgi:hypothetical protein
MSVLFGDGDGYRSALCLFVTRLLGDRFDRVLDEIGQRLADLATVADDQR